MHKRVKIALAVFLVAVASVLGWQVLREHEPSYQGKSLSVWLEEGYADGHFVAVTEQMAKRTTDEAVRQMGTNAIPPLLRRLRARDSSLLVWAVALAEKQRVIKLQFYPAHIRRLQGRLGLQALEDNASKAAVAELAEWLNSPDPEVRRDATNALKAIDPAAAARAGVQ